MFKQITPFAIASLFVIGSAQAIPLTVTMTGIVDSGGSRSFGSVIEDLSGKAYTLSFTVDPSLYTYYASTPTRGDAYGHNDNPVTVNFTSENITSTFTLLTSAGLGGNIYAHTYHGSTPSTQHEDLGAYADLYNATGSRVGVQLDYYSHVNTGLVWNFLQTTTHAINSADGFSGTSLVGYADGNASYINYWDYDAQTLTLNAAAAVPKNPAAAVPEPNSYILMLTGLGLIGAVVNGRKANQQT